MTQVLSSQVWGFLGKRVNFEILRLGRKLLDMCNYQENKELDFFIYLEKSKSYCCFPSVLSKKIGDISKQKIKCLDEIPMYHAPEY